MHKVDLYGEGFLTVVLSHQEVTALFRHTVGMFQRINRLTERALKSAEKYPHDKATIDLGKLRSRTLLGATERTVVSRTFSSRRLTNPDSRRRYSTNVAVLWNRESGYPYCIMDGNPLYDFRTASTVAVGVHCLGISNDDVLCMLGAGPVATASVFALGALEHPPREIRMTAKRKMGFKTVKERLNALFRRFDPALLRRTSLVACETIKQTLAGSTVIVDVISRTAGPVIDEALLPPEIVDRITYVDVGKEALSSSLVPRFSAYIFDNLKLGYKLNSPASEALRQGRCNVHAKKCDITQLLNREISAKDLEHGRLLTVMGVASVDAQIAEDAFRRLSKVSEKP
jgi:ornithine cyclodeaminase/alanine dehydrogenase-like protein (mu-crystallin family)